jgi:hypothetical protein
MNVLPIEEMTHLAKRLGHSGMDPIRYARKANTSKEPNSTNLENTVIRSMQATQPNTPHCQVNDLVAAAANLDSHQSKPLNINRLFNILRCIEMINTREIMTMTNLDKRQAQKYLRAVKFIIPYLGSHFRSTAASSSV